VGTPLSLRAYGRHRKALGLPGGNAVSVSRAIASQRLRKSVVLVGDESKIADPVLADAEWAENTDLSRAPSTVKAASGVTEHIVTDGLVAYADVTDRPRRGTGRSTLTEASTREKNARADLAELEYRAKAGELVPAKAVEVAWSEMVAQMRTAVLSVPSKAKGVMPHLSYADLAQFNDLLCQALEGLADKPPAQAKGAAA
jgi:hypothetical protein